jgi:Ca-activated chloride channel family protein
MINVTFDNPLYLWYLLSIPFLAYTHFYFFKHTKLKAIKFANFDALKRISGEKLITKNISLLILRSILLACIIISVSEMTIWHEGLVNENDFIIAIDISASMAAQDVTPTRIEAAKNYAIEIINNFETVSNVGIVTFSGTTFIDSALINNKDTLIKTIQAIELAKAGGTDISGAIITSTNMLISSDKGKTIILMTDGSNTVGSFISDSVANALEYAKRNHVIIHAIGIGSDNGPIGYLPEYYNISSVYNENSLIDITNQTGGKYFSVKNNSELKTIKENLEESSSKAMIPIKTSYGLMLIALLLLFIEWGLINTRFRRIP